MVWEKTNDYMWIMTTPPTDEEKAAFKAAWDAYKPAPTPDIESRIKALVTRIADRSAAARAMYEGKSATFVNVQTSVDDYDGEDDRDTDPPPPMSAVACYWCGKKATVEIYHGIHSCGECHDRALRSKRR